MSSASVQHAGILGDLLAGRDPFGICDPVGDGASGGLGGDIYGIEVVTHPAGGAGAFVSIERLRNELRIDFTNDDSEITAMRDAAAAWCLMYLRRRGLVGTYREHFRAFPGGRGSSRPLVLSATARPFGAVTSVVYTDTDGNEQTLDAGAYTVDTHRRPPALRPSDASGWPGVRQETTGIEAGAQVAVTYTAGSADADALNAEIPQLTQAVIVMVRAMYDGGPNALDPDGLTTESGTIRAVQNLLATFRTPIG